MTMKIFICYRRDESAAAAGRVHDRLEREFHRDLLFMDVDTIQLGENFVHVLRAAVGQCDVLLAVMGPNWLNAIDEEGKRRLDNPSDYVRIEIAAALQRHIPVIPILLDGAIIPKAAALPKDLEELPHRAALDVRHASFQGDMDRLIQALKKRLVGAGVSSGSTTAPTESRAPLVERTPGEAATKAASRRWPLLRPSGAVAMVLLLISLMAKTMRWVASKIVTATVVLVAMGGLIATVTVIINIKTGACVIFCSETTPSPLPPPPVQQPPGTPPDKHTPGAPPNDGLRSWIYLGKYSKTEGWRFCPDYWVEFSCKTLDFPINFDPYSFDPETDPNHGAYKVIVPATLNLRFGAFGPNGE
jgi:TIR domain